MIKNQDNKVVDRELLVMFQTLSLGTLKAAEVTVNELSQYFTHVKKEKKCDFLKINLGPFTFELRDR